MSESESEDDRPALDAAESGPGSEADLDARTDGDAAGSAPDSDSDFEIDDASCDCE
jgi:hypothetical protein